MSAINNLIECLIEREGPTIFHIGKVQYIFAPRPELTGDMTASVCVVISQEHRDYLLKDRMCSGYYRKYEPKTITQEMLNAAEMEEFRQFQEMKKRHTPDEIARLLAQQSETEVEGEEEPPPAVTVPKKAPGRPKAAQVEEKPEPPEAGPSADPMAEMF
jgi:hypothetical protein